MNRIFVLIMLSGLILCCNTDNTKSTLESQSSVPSHSVDASEVVTCQEGKVEAQHDIDNGELGYYFYGLPNPRFNTFVRVASEEFNLMIKGGGDIIDKAGECYNEVIKKEIERIYGKNAFKMIDLKVDSMETMGLIDRHARFPGGEERLNQYIYCGLDASLFKNDTEPELVVSCEISETGRIENLRIRRLRNLDQDSSRYLAEVSKILNNMPTWIPGQAEQKPVRYNWNMSVTFSKEIRNHYCD